MSLQVTGTYQYNKPFCDPPVAYIREVTDIRLLRGDEH